MDRRAKRLPGVRRDKLPRFPGTKRRGAHGLREVWGARRRNEARAVTFARRTRDPRCPPAHARQARSPAARLLPLLALVPFAAAGWIAYSELAIDHGRAAPAAGARQAARARRRGGTAGPARRRAGQRRTALLLHSINAAASAYEVRPLYEHFGDTRPVYALDLPGFGFSAREARTYTPRVMTDAIHGAVAAIRARHGGAPVDAVALSLTCEYLARAALERRGDYRSLGLISPTGFDRVLSGEARCRAIAAVRSRERSFPCRGSAARCSTSSSRRRACASS